jgi:hypothetical protein
MFVYPLGFETGLSIAKVIVEMTIRRRIMLLNHLFSTNLPQATRKQFFGPKQNNDFPCSSITNSVFSALIVDL